MEYEINEGTLAIIPSEKNSIIFEDKEKKEYQKSPYEIIDYSCKFFGSSYQGRKEGTKSILNVSYKLPIIVESSKNIIFFPTNSPTDNDCCWISLKNIERIEECEYNTTNIVFNNGVSIKIPISKRSIENQILRSSRLDSIMRNRKI